MATCPFDDSHQYTVCAIKACPYHCVNAATFIKYDAPVTQCVIRDIPIVAEAIHDKSPWTLLSKHGLLHPSLNIRALRRILDFTVAAARSLVYVITEVPKAYGCATCGSTKCHGGKDCEERVAWVERILFEKLACKSTPVTRANVWELLRLNKLEINDAILIRNGNRLEEQADADHDA